MPAFSNFHRAHFAVGIAALASQVGDAFPPRSTTRPALVAVSPFGPHRPMPE
jgi:hypothetical protein